VEGQNIAIEWRNAGDDRGRFPGLAADLVSLDVDVIVVAGPGPMREAAKATKTIPLVMIASSDDPVGRGYVTTLARPGGNITGLTFAVTPEINAKLLEVLKEVQPTVSRVAFLEERSVATHLEGRREWEAAIRPLRLTLLPPALVRDPHELAPAFASMVRERADAVYVPMVGVTYAHRGRVADLAKKHRLPAIAILRELPEAGGLLSYGPDVADIYRRGALYVDKILRGAKAAELPVEQPTKFDLVVNLKTAKTLGLTIPPSVRVRADLISP
jgi:putative ABC transport system substrate-binding protein